MLSCLSWGPLFVCTPIGHCYIYIYLFIIVDDQTHVLCLYFMRYKSNALQVLLAFYAFVQTQFNYSIKAARNDNALKLNFTQFYIDKGIQAIHSYAKTLEQNSLV